MKQYTLGVKIFLVVLIVAYSWVLTALLAAI